jgi:hypothetical protein
MVLDKKTQRTFDKELRIPCNLNHIADRVLKVSREEAKILVDKWIQEGVLVESELAKNYFRLNNV